MNMFEEAKTINAMIKMRGLTQSEIAKQMGVSQSYVANKIRLLSFSDEIQSLITESGLTERHARLLLRLKKDEEIRSAVQKISAMHLSVAASEVLIDGMITEYLPNNIPTANDKSAMLEQIISKSVLMLRSHGIKAKYKTDVCGGKKYITVCIEE